MQFFTFFLKVVLKTQHVFTQHVLYDNDVCVCQNVQENTRKLCLNLLTWLHCIYCIFNYLIVLIIDLLKFIQLVLIKIEYSWVPNKRGCPNKGVLEH